MMATSYTLGKGMTDLAYGEYQAFADNALAFKRWWSRSGTKMQKKPIRSEMLWKIPTLPVTGSKMQGLPISNARDWVVRTDLNTLTRGLGYKGYNTDAVQEVSISSPTILSVESVVLGAIIGWLIGKRITK